MSFKISLTLFFLLSLFFFSNGQDLNKIEESQAYWITSSNNQSKTNTWIAFRRENIEITKVPKFALAKIAVDSKYWLWINGKQIVFEGGLKRGPNPKDTYYDEIDIAPYLKEGENTISLLLWYFGKDGFSHNSSGKAALFFECISPDFSILSDKSWWSIIHPGYFQSPPLPDPNFRLPESHVYFDARKDLGLWTSAEYKAGDHGFSSSVELGPVPAAPWNNLVKRPIPLWKDFGMKEYVGQRILSGKEIDTIECKLPYNAQITPFLEVESVAGAEIGIQTDAYEWGKEYSVRAAYVTKSGRQSYESLGWMNGNKVFYLIPKGVKTISLKYRETGYNTEFTGSFSSNVQFYNLLWEKARRTLYITMRDTYMDCPDRERANWIGDAVNETGEAFYALDTNSYALFRKTLYELVDWQRWDSVLYAPVPSGNWDKELPNQVMAMVGYYGYWNYYLNTRDLKTMKDLYNRIKNYVDIWKLNEKGTVVFRQGGWLWGDWGENKDIELLENAWYALALKGMIKVADVLGKESDLIYYQQRLEDLKKAVNSQFWNGESYRSPNYKDSTDDRGQALAVLSGIAEKDKYDKIVGVLKREEHASPYMEKYVLEALFKMRQPEYALYRMRKRFEPMVSNPHYTTLFEAWKIGKELSIGWTFNHAWSGGGLTLLSQYVCGISPIEPGYKRFKVDPQLGLLKDAEAVIPTILGEISITLKKEEKTLTMNLSVPKGSQAEIHLPAGYHGIMLKDEDSITDKDIVTDILKLDRGKYTLILR